MVVLCTAPDRATAQLLVERLLKNGLAACVTVVPGAESHYVWEGKRERSEEFLLLIKTTAGRYLALEKEVTATHPYKCPELLGLAVKEAWEPYAQWVRQSVRN